MKALFLDIDGVLCTPKSHSACFGRISPFNSWDKTSCAMIARICNNLGFKIVVSSTWRLLGEVIIEHLSEYGLSEYVYKEDPMTNSTMLYMRGDEIKEWLDRNTVNDYIIIDDLPESEFLDEQQDHLIRVVDNHNGFGYFEFMMILKRYDLDELKEEL